MGVALAQAHGVVFVHSVAAAMAPHVQWALERILEQPVDLAWAAQPVAPGTLRAELSWVGRRGTAGRIASALRGWERLRFEATEDAADGGPGDRYAWTPALGMFHAAIAGTGDLLVGECQLRVAMARAVAGEADLAAECDRLLGQAWDEELEPFRRAGDGAGGGAAVRWLHEVG